MMQVKAPPGWRPDDALSRPVNAPPVHSPFRKFDLYRSVEQFTGVDNHAIQVAQTDHDNFNDFMWHLVYSANIQSDLDKARVIFRWMTSKNMHSMNFSDGARPGSPEEILLSFKTKQGTYARIFETLCRFCGLRSEVLTGFAKGLDYRPGESFKDKDYNHSWNAVLIDSNWYLVDSHWATRYLVSEKNMPENLVYEYDDFYFLTDPEQLVYSHWSQKGEWQLLKEAVTLPAFENLPLVKSYFFRCAMHFVSHHQGIIHTKQGRLALTLGHYKPVNFTYKITFGDTGESVYQGENLKNFALQHQGRNQTGTFLFRAPRPGPYYFSIFAQMVTGEVGVKSVFTAACEYKVVADTASWDAGPLPVCSDSAWGPSMAVEQLGLEADPAHGILTTTDGRVDLLFRKTRPAGVLCKLRRNGMQEEELENFIRDIDTDQSVQVTAHLPSPGEYGIEVYGNDPIKDGDTFTHICQYYVHFATPTEQQQAFYQESPERPVAMVGSLASSGGFQSVTEGTQSVMMGFQPTVSAYPAPQSGSRSVAAGPQTAYAGFQTPMGTSRAPAADAHTAVGTFPGGKAELQVGMEMSQPPAGTFRATMVNTGAPAGDSRANTEDSRATMGMGSSRGVTGPGGYSAGSVGLDTATASLTLKDPVFDPNDPDSLPPPPPELLEDQPSVSSSFPDRRQHAVVSTFTPNKGQADLRYAPGTSQPVRGQATLAYSPGQTERGQGDLRNTPGTGQLDRGQSDLSYAPGTGQATITFSPGTKGQGNLGYIPGTGQVDQGQDNMAPGTGQVDRGQSSLTFAPGTGQLAGDGNLPYAPGTVQTERGQVKPNYALGTAKPYRAGTAQPYRAQSNLTFTPVTAQLDKGQGSLNLGAGQTDRGQANLPYAPGTGQVDRGQANLPYAPGTGQVERGQANLPYTPGTGQVDRGQANLPYAPGTGQVERGQANLPYAPGTGQVERGQANLPYAPGTGQVERGQIGLTFTPGSGQTDRSQDNLAYAPGTGQMGRGQGTYAPGTGQMDRGQATLGYASGPGQTDRSQGNLPYTPGTSQMSGTYAPGTSQMDRGQSNLTYAPGSGQTDRNQDNLPYTPGTSQIGRGQGTYAPGTGQMDRGQVSLGYAPGPGQTDRSQDNLPYTPGTGQISGTYVPGTGQMDRGQGNITYAPGSGQTDRSQDNLTHTPGVGQVERGRGNVVYTPGGGQTDRDQGMLTYTPGVRQMNRAPQPQKAVVTSVAVIPASSTPLQVQRRSVGQAAPTAPRDFELAAVVPDKGEAPPPEPAPSTSTPQLKPSLDAIDRQVLHSVDDHAIQVSKSDHTTFRDLVWDLIYSKNITNEIEKVRVIFRWLATKNLKEMTFDKVEKGSPEEVLMGLKTGTTTYAMLFDTMCSFAGLHSQIISGYAKGADYLPGMHFAPGQNEHSWNAIYIYGTWCLVDAHWAARRLVGKQTSAEDFHYQLDEYFFLPDPNQLIYTHFPLDPRWQLLEHSVTLGEFESMPHMKPQFFKYGLEFVTHTTAVIHSRSELVVRLRYRDPKTALAFNFTIQTDSGSDEYKGTKLTKYGIHECVDGVASFTLRLPVSGSYMLFIYAKDSGPDTQDNVYSQVCEYRVQHEAPPGGEVEPYPPCNSLTWGTGPAFHRYGLTTTQQSATMETQGGQAELRVEQQRPVQFLAKLKHSMLSEEDLEGCILQRSVGSTVIFTVTPPRRGTYGLDIFANDPAKEGQMLYHSAQFLVVCQEDVTAKPLPKLPPGYLGPQPKFGEFGLVAASHPDPVIHLDSNAVTVTLQCPQPMRILTNLISVEGERDMSQFTFSNMQGSTVALLVHPPTAGFYKLQIFGIPVADTRQELPGIYNYLLDVQQATQAVYPFPKQFAQWKEGCAMAQPCALPSGAQIQKERLPDMVTFRVTVPKAKAVAVVAGQEWTHLERGSGDDWSGDVKVGQCYGNNTKVTLNANFGGDKTSYATLLEYIL